MSNDREALAECAVRCGGEGYEQCAVWDWECAIAPPSAEKCKSCKHKIVKPISENLPVVEAWLRERGALGYSYEWGGKWFASWLLKPSDSAGGVGLSDQRACARAAVAAVDKVFEMIREERDG